jgi:hypothetical protein
VGSPATGWRSSSGQPGISRGLLLLTLAATLLVRHDAAAQGSNAGSPASCVVTPLTNAYPLSIDTAAPVLHVQARTGLYRALVGERLDLTLVDPTGQATILTVDPQQPGNVLYARGTMIYQSTDGGTSGTPISANPGITFIARRKRPRHALCVR